MINTKKFGDYLKNLGYDFYTGVPCSWMKNLINYAQNDCNYINAGNEGDAVSVASGAYLAGKKPIVLMQNSGLGNAISPLTSLNSIFKIPILIFVSMREGSDSTPQHAMMEKISKDLVELIKMNHVTLSKNITKAKKQINDAEKTIKVSNLPFFIFVNKDTFTKIDLKEKEKKNNPINKKYNNEILLTSNRHIKRYEALEEISSYDQDTIFIATTGKTARELYDIGDKENNFYMVGSMGCASSIGLGIALNSNKKVIVIDGDGAGIMRLSALPMIAEQNPKNLLHIMMDNNSHDSTGGQTTLSHLLSWSKFAGDLGYSTIKINDLQNLKYNLKLWHKNPNFCMIEIPISKGSKDNLGRPDIKPHEVKERLFNYLKKSNNE